MEDLFCPLCKEEYNNRDKAPRLFPNCGHTFCTDCIKDIIERGNEGIYCPEDGIKCEFYKKSMGFHSFPYNFALKGLLEKRNSKRISKVNQNILSEISGMNYCLEHQKIADLICLTD